MKIKNIPKHIAIIPDGNRRWATKRGFQPWIGHRAGMKIVEKILLKAKEMNLSYLTFWVGSWDNLTQRKKIEIKFLFKLYHEYFKKALKDKRVHEDKVKINVFGRWKEILPKETQKIIEKAIETTKNYHKYFLTLLIAYDGRDEMINCIEKIVNLVKMKKVSKITPEIIKENLWTKDLPPVDLVIRTGCEEDPHLSAGFMMWDTSYSQLYFTKTLFPDFTPEEFENIIKDYSQRERRMGR